ncbi:MAG: hypothetical protein NC395_08220 [Prevotella sp.]|nr:hypothetical protein [Prevotella sp.]
MKTKAKIGVGGVIGIILIAVCAAFFGYKAVKAVNERKAKQALFEAAAENAVEYVREKYGFEAEIADFDDFDNNDYLFKKFNEIQEDMQIIKLRANGREFFAEAECSEENPYCIDNYQFEEIQSAAMDEILKGIPEGKTVSVSWSAYEDMPRVSAVNILGFNKYYDGGNLDEFLEIGYGYVEMIFVGENISESGIPERLEELHIDYMFNSFDTAEHMEEYLAVKEEYESAPFHLLNDPDLPLYKLYAPHIIDHADLETLINVENSEAHKVKTKTSYETKELENFRYCCFYKGNSNIYVEKMDHDKFADRYDGYGKVKCLDQPMSNAYSSDMPGRLYIYYPVDELNGLNIKHLGAAWVDGGDRSIRSIESGKIYGDYVVFILPGEYDGYYGFSNIDFMLVDRREFSA